MKYLEKHYPSYQIIIQETDLLGNGIFIEILHLKNDQGEQRTLYFYISEYMEQVNELQTKHLQTNYPEYEFYARHLWLVGTTFISRLSLRKDDETKIIMFDVSDYMQEYRKTHQIKLTEILPSLNRRNKPLFDPLPAAGLGNARAASGKGKIYTSV